MEYKMTDDKLRKENEELTSQLDWWSKLVDRGCIGTAKTASLRAYIEQIEAENGQLKALVDSVEKILKMDTTDRYMIQDALAKIAEFKEGK